MRHEATLACCCLLAVGCKDRPDDETAASPAIDSAAAALTGDTVRDTTRVPGDTTVTDSAVVQDAAGKQLGVVHLAQGSGGIAVTGAVTGLPAGVHGFHVHAVGRCDPPGFESAGPHWNPANRQHGSANPNGPHAGDLGNLSVTADGVGNVSATTHGGTMAELNDADGAAVVVHEKADDERTDPSGNSGGRIACGVVHAAP